MVRKVVPHKKSSRTAAGTRTHKKHHATKMVYCFGRTRTDGDGSMKSLLGGKGANLAEMTGIGLPVPPGFTITTECCDQYHRQGRQFPKGLMGQVHDAVALLEKETGKHFGSQSHPLLVSVRSGAAVSMPGMMDTVLNLGLTDQSVRGLADGAGNERFACDAYRRLLNMFGNVVMGVDHSVFEEQFERIKKQRKVELDTDVDTDGLIELCDVYKKVIRRHAKRNFPQDPFRQLELGIEAVFRSWHTARAIRYRQINEITGLCGTAVNVQAMVFGNMGDNCGTGVAFTRNPSTGVDEFYGEFLINAQGEDVVAGIRTPVHVDQMTNWKTSEDPDIGRRVHKKLLQIKTVLEKHYHDMQDIEFTIEMGRLYMLQTRVGKRTGAAAVKIACDMVRQRRINQKIALARIPANDLTQLLLPSFDPLAKRKVAPLAIGLPASPGAAVGRLAFTAEEAVRRSLAGESVLLVRKETSPEDIDGMHSAAGILTSTGGMTSHAAVVARGWGKCCVAGAGTIRIDERKRQISVTGTSYSHGDTLSIDGSTGEVFVGQLATCVPKLSSDFNRVMGWADRYRRLRVRTNADTPGDAKRAREFGAEGIGLCRTEHMFFEGDRIIAMRQMILAEAKPDREKALKKLLPFQRRDFEGIFKAMKNLPVTIRLLDPPLHEFLPHDDAAQQEVARTLGVPVGRIRSRIEQLHEMNPMLGHRGCRLLITYPEVLVMQVTAIVEAAINCRKKRIRAVPEIMIPLVSSRKELATLRELTITTIAAVKKAKRFMGKLTIAVGTMIEVPRAALCADEVAQEADFFSFGTNDLTQMTFGFSRDDVNSFLPDYLQQELLAKDPFESLDTSGVGQLVQMGVAKGRSTRSSLKVGICGEHGGDPPSIRFCHETGLDYVSCSPFRVPIARLAAAQAALD